MALGEESGERKYAPTVGERYRVAQPKDWPIDTAEARAALFRFFGPDMEEKDFPEFTAALDTYVAGVVIGLANEFENLGMNATGLTGPAWYGEGFKDAMRHIEETGWAIDPG